MNIDNEPRIVEWNHYSNFMGTDTIWRVDPSEKETELIVTLLRDMQVYREENPPIGYTSVDIICKKNDTEHLIQILEATVPIKELTKEQINLLVGGVMFIIARLHFAHSIEMREVDKGALDANTAIIEGFLLRIGHKGFYDR